LEVIPTHLKKVIFSSLLIGAVLGVVLAYFLFPKTNNNQEDIVSEIIIYDTIYVEKQKIVYRTKYIETVGNDSLKGEILLGDSLQDSLLIAQGGLPIDSNQSVDQQDSSGHNNMPLAQNQPKDKDGRSPEIKIAKNELLETHYLIPEGNPNNFYCQSNSDLDSLLIDNYTTKAKEEGIQLEFWRSPINTVGYKLSRSKLVLYGFYEFDRLGLKYMKDGSIQMNYLNNTYILKCGSQFRSLNIEK